MQENLQSEPKQTAQRPKILLLTSSLLVDRVFIYTKLVETLSEFADVHIWAASRQSSAGDNLWKDVAAFVEPMPPIAPFKQFPHVYLRRLNEFIWDYRHPIPSRVSMRRHHLDKKLALSVSALRFPARLLAALKAEEFCERHLEKLLLSYQRSPEAEKRLRELNPAAVVLTGPFQFEQPAIGAAAKNLGIPTLAYVPSWDNVTTKNRMVFKYGGYLVWSEQKKSELQKYYPDARRKPIYVTGAPQYDVFKNRNFFESREDFCRRQELDSALPIILYALGSPNFLQEHHGAIRLAESVAGGELGKVQMLVRPHPIHDNAELHHLFDDFAPHVKIQCTPNAGKNLTERSQDESEIRDWINTFRHAAVTVNLSSTVTVDAAIFDCPVVNLDFDPQPGQADEQLIHEINHEWNHFQPVAESGGVWLVKNFAELKNAVQNYLRNPDLHHVARKWIPQYVCEYTDGRCGERMAAAIAAFAHLAEKENSAQRRRKISPREIAVLDHRHISCA